jgi:hypothetical protein
MNTIYKYILLSILLVSILPGNAQSVDASTMQKVKADRAFYETLGKLYPADNTVAVDVVTSCQYDSVDTY